MSSDKGKGRREYAEDQDGNSSASTDFHSDDEYAWIPWFCSLKGNEFFCELDESFVQDAFNLTGLNGQVEYYDAALDMILDVEPSPDEVLSDERQELIENDAENLFGLIHARYILTNRGLHQMMEKFRGAHFGRCPRVLCKGQATLPVGMFDQTNQDSVKLYCPLCEEVYAPKSSRHEHIDGAFFGTTFPHLFFLTFPELKPQKPVDLYVPRVFGFRVHKTAYKRSLEQKVKEQAARGDRSGSDAAPIVLAEEEKAQSSRYRPEEEEPKDAGRAEEPKPRAKTAPKQKR